MLRTHTARHHEQVDAVFGRFDLDDAAGYGRFLRAHHAALSVIEPITQPMLPERLRQPRLPALERDMKMMNVAPSSGLALSLPWTAAERWGALYVVEGSRLGGAVLEKHTGREFPTAYLSMKHRPGSWAETLDELDKESAGQGAEWHEACISGAVAAFCLFETAGRRELEPQLG